MENIFKNMVDNYCTMRSQTTTQFLVCLFDTAIHDQSINKNKNKKTKPKQQERHSCLERRKKNYGCVGRIKSSMLGIISSF